MKRAAFLSLFLVLTVFAWAACSIQYGDTNPEPSSDPSTNAVRGQNFTVSAGTTVQVCDIQFYAFGAGTSAVAGIYDDSGSSSPTTLIVASAETWCPANTFTILTLAPTLISGNKWMEVINQGSAKAYNSGSGDVSFFTFTYNGTLPSNISSSSIASGYMFSMFVDAQVPPTPTPTPGPATLPGLFPNIQW